MLYTGLKTGDVVWGKSMSGSWWPAIVYRQQSGRSKDSDSVQLLFIDTVPTTAWVNSKYVS